MGRPAFDNPGIAEDGIAVAAIGDLVLAYWVKPASVARWKKVVKEQRALIRTTGKPIMTITVIAETSSPPDRELRVIMQDDLRDLGKDLRRFVVVPLGSSVWQGVVRALVRTILMMSGQGKQTALCESIADAARLLRDEGTASTPRERDIEDALVELKARALASR